MRQWQSGHIAIGLFFIGQKKFRHLPPVLLLPHVRQFNRDAAFGSIGGWWLELANLMDTPGQPGQPMDQGIPEFAPIYQWNPDAIPLCGHQGQWLFGRHRFGPHCLARFYLSGLARTALLRGCRQGWLWQCGAVHLQLCRHAAYGICDQQYGL